MKTKELNVLSNEKAENSIKTKWQYYTMYISNRNSIYDKIIFQILIPLMTSHFVYDARTEVILQLNETAFGSGSKNMQWIHCAPHRLNNARKQEKRNNKCRQTHSVHAGQLERSHILFSAIITQLVHHTWCISWSMNYEYSYLS